jgi:C-terminal processing protease CtpA/Prc
MLVTALLVAGCDTSADNSFVGEPTSCSNDGQKQFVLDALYDWWLWNADLPANISIADYGTPEELVIRVTETYGPQQPDGTPLDRFSSVGSLAADQQFFGEGKYEGFGFRFNAADVQPTFEILGVFADSPAGASALARGQTVITLNGRTPEQIQAAEGINTFFDNTDSVTFVVEDVQGVELPPIEITRGIVTIDPVPQVRTISVGDGVPPVGYIQFESFISTAEPVFATVFAEFAAAGVTDIIIDMRYNGGGLVRTAELLGDYLGSLANPGDVFSRTEFNADRAAEFNRVDLFANPAITNALNTSRFIVIASGGTASAAELVTNSLIPYADVWIVGENTFGKPVGQVGIEFCDKILRPTSFRTTNALGDGDYFDGLPVDCPAIDDVTTAVGADDDPRLVAALAVAQTGACPLAPAAASRAQAVTVEPRVVFPESRGSAAREFAGAF